MAQIDYPAHLEVMWQKAIAPRESDAPTVISAFAGCGGSLTGYLMAGYRDLLAIEWDDNAVETLRLNWPDLDIYHGDIKDISVEDVLKRTGLKVGELDVLDGSPPCQGLSTAGKRIMSDPRNQLFREYVRLLRGLQPKTFVMENVTGMVKGKMKLIFVEILKELKASGYQVRAAKLNAKYFHVPQSRERIIFIGVRNDLGIKPDFPERESKLIAADKSICNVKNLIIGNPHGRIAEQMKTVEPGSNLGKSLRISSYFSYVRCPIGLPAMTLQKSVTHGGISMYHPTEDRNMSIGELQRICSFPDNYCFDTNYENAVNRMGNSVPPLMMEAIARNVKEKLLLNPVAK